VPVPWRRSSAVEAAATQDFAGCLGGDRPCLEGSLQQGSYPTSHSKFVWVVPLLPGPAVATQIGAKTIQPTSLPFHLYSIFSISQIHNRFLPSLSTDARATTMHCHCCLHPSPEPQWCAAFLHRSSPAAIPFSAESSPAAIVPFAARSSIPFISSSPL
jgi:hypothetical protein